MVARFTVLTGMILTSFKLRLFHAPGIKEAPHSLPSSPGITIQTKS